MHVVANCPSAVRVVFDKPPVTKLKSGSEESICQAEEPEDSDSDENITGDTLVESSTLSPLEVVPAITEFTDISHKDNTLIPSEVTPVITELTDISPRDSTLNLPKVTPIVMESVVFSEDLPDKLSLTYDIQHATELIPGANLSDLSHPRLDPTKQFKLKGQVDELSLEGKKSCLVPINIYCYEDKFWSNIVIRNVDQIKDVIIYGQSMFEN